MKKSPIKRILFQEKISYEDYLPDDEEGQYFRNLIETSPVILADYYMRGDKVSFREYCEYNFAFNNRVKWAFADYDTLSNEGAFVLPSNKSDQVIPQLREIYADQFCYIGSKAREGLPLYKKQGNDWVEMDFAEREILEDLHNEYCIGEDFKGISIQKYPFFDVYFSIQELDMQKIFFQSYESEGGIELAIRKRAFLLYRDGKLFDDDRKLSKLPAQAINSREREGLLKIIGALVVALANAKNNSLKMSNGEVSANAVAQHILQSVEEEQGLGESSVRRKIREALELVKAK